MSTTSRVDENQRRTAPAVSYSLTIDGEPCTVRATAVWPIPDALDAADQFVGGMLEAFHGPGAAESALIADVLESQMIAPPRPRHRRQKPMSSRALFFAG